MEQPAKDKNYKSLLIQVAVFVVVFAIAFFGTKFLFQKDIGDELQKVSAEMNKTLPMKIDAESRLDSTQYIAPKTMQYHYTALTIDSDSLTVDLNDLKKFLQNNTQKLLDSADQMKLFREHEVRMKYNYKDKNGKYLLDFTINPTKK